MLRPKTEKKTFFTVLKAKIAPHTPRVQPALLEWRFVFVVAVQKWAKKAEQTRKNKKHKKEEKQKKKREKKEKKRQTHEGTKSVRHTKKRRKQRKKEGHQIRQEKEQKKRKNERKKKGTKSGKKKGTRLGKKIYGSERRGPARSSVSFSECSLSVFVSTNIVVCCFCLSRCTNSRQASTAIWREALRSRI